jgi:tetratricopeptide (TPR) repeat protein
VYTHIPKFACKKDKPGTNLKSAPTYTCGDSRLRQYLESMDAEDGRSGRGLDDQREGGGDEGMAAAVAALRERQVYINTLVNFGILLASRQHNWRGALKLLRLAFAAAPNDGEVLAALRALLQRLKRSSLVHALSAAGPVQDASSSSRFDNLAVSKEDKDKEVRMKEIKRRKEREEREKMKEAALLRHAHTALRRSEGKGETEDRAEEEGSRKERARRLEDRKAAFALTPAEQQLIQEWVRVGLVGEGGDMTERGGDGGGGWSGKGGEAVVSEKVLQESCWFNCGADLWGLAGDCRFMIRRKFCAGYGSGETEVPSGLGRQIMLNLQSSIMESACMTKRSRAAASKMARSLELDQSRFCDDPEVSVKLAAHLLGSFWFYCQLDPHTKLQSAEGETNAELRLAQLARRMRGVPPGGQSAGGAYVVDTAGAACNILLQESLQILHDSIHLLKHHDPKDRMRQHIELATLLLLELVSSRAGRALMEMARKGALNLKLNHVLSAAALHEAEMNKQETGISALQQALQIQPTNIPCLISLSRLLIPCSCLARNPLAPADLRRRSSQPAPPAPLSVPPAPPRGENRKRGEGVGIAALGSLRLERQEAEGLQVYKSEAFEDFHCFLKDSPSGGGEGSRGVRRVDLERAMRQVLRALLLTRDDLTVWHQQALVYLATARRHRVKHASRLLVTDPLPSGDGMPLKAHALEFKAFESISMALKASGPLHEVPQGRRGSHVPSLLLYARLLLDFVIRRNTFAIERLQAEPSLLHLAHLSRGGRAEEVQRAMLDQAEEIFRLVVTREPDNIEALSEWAQVLQAAGDYQQAQRVLEHALVQADRRSRDGHFSKGNLLTLLGPQIYYQGGHVPQPHFSPGFSYSSASSCFLPSFPSGSLPSRKTVAGERGEDIDLNSLTVHDVQELGSRRALPARIFAAIASGVSDNEAGHSPADADDKEEEEEEEEAGSRRKHPLRPWFLEECYLRVSLACAPRSRQVLDLRLLAHTACMPAFQCAKRSAELKHTRALTQPLLRAYRRCCNMLRTSVDTRSTSFRFTNWISEPWS